MPEFAHLHVHTEYSLLDGACKIKELCGLAKSLGQKHIAITDHGAMFGVYEFYKTAVEEGIHPIIGCEVYVAPKSRFDRRGEQDMRAAHLVLLCQNETGYKNLIKIVSQGYTEGFYNKPRVDMELLKAHAEGLICLSACLAGAVPRLIEADEYDEAKALAAAYAEIYPGRYYLELQDHGIAEQKKVNNALIRISRELGLPLVATNDAHYLRREDAELQDVLLCIQTGKTVGDADRMRFETQEFYIKSADEMAELFPNQPEALENTVKIAESCNFEFKFTGFVQPRFKLPEGEESAESCLRRRCEEGLIKRYGPEPPESHKKRLEYELGVITTMGFSDYYLVVADYVGYAKSVGIPVGPGRGSGAGSIAAYCLGITNICPMKYGLYFERFLNPERKGMPDFDVDFCPKRRGEVIDYMSRTYGANHVAQIATFGTMAARAAIRDVGRALAIPLARVDQIAKLIPNELHITLAGALEKSDELRRERDADADVARLLQTAQGLEGMPRNVSTHAAGVVVTPLPTSDYVPLSKNDDVVVTEFDMDTLKAVGLVKMDFLGLRNLTIIADAEELIRRREPGFNIDDIPDDDAQTFAMIAEGKTTGVFQLESGGMTGVAVGMRSQSIEEITAVIALYRPGPMDSIARFIDGKRNPSHVRYKHPLLKDILAVTYGCPLYQEQVMEIFRRLGGYSMGRADVIRDAISKKKTEKIAKERENFIYGNAEEGIPGCIGNGVPEKTAIEIFDEVMSFGGYAFNKAHAAAYALVSYQTAYLKCRYPQEYLGALLTSVLDRPDKVADYTAEAKSMGIAVLPPSVQSSEEHFTVEGKDIRFGLCAIKNVGEKLITDLVAERKKNGSFASYADFCSRMCVYDFNRRTAEALIRAGACDCFGLFRAQMLLMFDDIVASAQTRAKKAATGQLSLFGEDEEEAEPAPPKVEEFPRRELLAMEKESTGIYLSGHPLDEFLRDFELARVTPIRDIVGEDEPDSEYADGESDTLVGNTAYNGALVTVGGMATTVRQRSTKAGQQMAIVTLEDLNGVIEALVFPKTLTEYGAFIRQDNALVCEGHISLRENEKPKLLIDRCRLAVTEDRLAARVERPQPAPAIAPGAKVFLRLYDESDKMLRRLCGLFAMFPGERQVVLYYPASGRRMQAERGSCVNDDGRLYAELRRLLGEENVIIK